MLSIVAGPQDPPLWRKTTRQLVDEQATTYGEHTALIVPWQGVRLSFKDLAYRSTRVSKLLLGLGLKHGDAVGIMAGNRVEYLEVFLGASRIGCPLVLLHNTYTAHELCSAVVRSCKNSSYQRLTLCANCHSMQNSLHRFGHWTKDLGTAYRSCVHEVF